MIEKARIHKSKQFKFFLTSPTKVCQDIGLNWITAIQLYTKGFLSFNPETTENLNDEQKAELTFLGYLVVTGCDERLLEKLLSGLDKPYSYNMNVLYYYWPYQEWRLCQESEENKETIFENWLEELRGKRQIDKLTSIMTLIRQAINRANEESINSFYEYLLPLTNGNEEWIEFDYKTFLSRLGLLGLLSFGFALNFDPMPNDDSCCASWRFLYEKDSETITLTMIERVNSGHGSDVSEQIELVFNSKGEFHKGQHFYGYVGELKEVKYFEDIESSFNHWINLGGLDKPTTIEIHSD